MSESDKERSVRKAIVDEIGRRDSEEILNQNKDLSDRFCERPFDFFEAHDLITGKAFVCCPTWLPTSIGNLTEDSVEDVFNSEEAQEIRESILDGSFCKCDHKLCPLIQSNSLPKKEGIKDKRHRKIIDENITKDLEPIYYNLCYDESCNLQCPSCRANKFFLKEGPDYERKIKIQEKIITDLFLTQEHKYSFNFFRRWKKINLQHYQKRRKLGSSDVKFKIYLRPKTKETNWLVKVRFCRTKRQLQGDVGLRKDW